jgi:hypothetical protein
MPMFMNIDIMNRALIFLYALEPERDRYQHVAHDHIQ